MGHVRTVSAALPPVWAAQYDRETKEKKPALCATQDCREHDLCHDQQHTLHKSHF
eukprot:m.904182 g.904182  ORF g.904182 m.904182 type:complete len:55 (+) comp23695_c0_seq5:2558-2722(+)